MLVKELEKILGDVVAEIEVNNDRETYTVNILEARPEVRLTNAVFGTALMEFAEFEVKRLYVLESGFSLTVSYSNETYEALKQLANRLQCNITHVIYNEAN